MTKSSFIYLSGVNPRSTCLSRLVRWARICGFSDAMFGVIAAFLNDVAGLFVAEIEAIEP